MILRVKRAGFDLTNDETAGRGTRLTTRIARVASMNATLGNARCCIKRKYK